MAEIGLMPVGSATFAHNFDSFVLRATEWDALVAIEDETTRELLRDLVRRCDGRHIQPG